MAFSRNSIRRVIGEMVNRNSEKSNTIDLLMSGRSKTNHRSRKKSERSSTISNSSASLSQTCYQRLNKCENDFCKSLNYLDQVLTHHKFEILTNTITSLIEIVFDIDNILKGIFENQSETFRSNILRDVFSLLGDLIDWGDQIFLEQNTNSKNEIEANNRYKQLAQDLMQALRNCISLACKQSPKLGSEIRSDSCQSFRSISNSTDEFPPALPPKREKRPVSSSATIISNRSRTNDETKHSLILSSSSSPMKVKQETDNDARIQSILDDINHIVENYTRELDDGLRNKTNVRSPSIDYLSSKSSTSIQSPTHRHGSFDTFYETQISRITKSKTTKTTIDDGQGTIDTKVSSQIYDGTDYSIQTRSGEIQTQKLTIINRQKAKDETEQEKTIITTHINASNQQNYDPPPLPPKRKTARAYMSLFDRYNHDEANPFLQDVTLISTPQRRFEDLFEQIQQHFQQMQIFSNFDDAQRTKKTLTKTISTSSESSNYYEDNDRNSLASKISVDDEQKELFLENITHLLVFHSQEDPSLRGGSIDALIIRATSPDKQDFVYQEAFLTTYRTFISPSNLIDKLIQRYIYFSSIPTKLKIARYAFSLLIRVVDEIDNELNESLMKPVSLFVSSLIRHGELQLGKLLRKKSFERFRPAENHSSTSQQEVLLIQNPVASKRSILLDFHSSDISEQLTLLDSELFLKIQLSEILYMSIEKGEDYSPNLAAFTDHFNSISYWVRSRILEQNSQRQREIYFEKFLKILKHLRRLNNFNSYLAILSALDSGPLKRLPWSKSINEAIAEHTDLIDSTGSFKNYREAFNASIGQPCIPYIGLILSDLTFVHIGNSDFLSDGRTVNFWKRWQQFTILQKLRYCRKWEHKFTRNDRILNFFNNFDDFMNEEAQWIQSEKIKPRQKPTIYA